MIGVLRRFGSRHSSGPFAASEAAAFGARINAPSDWARVISDTARLVSRLQQLGEPNLLPSQVCALLDGLSPDALTAATILAPQVQADYIRRYLDSWWSVAPILRGSDLLQLGVPAGPDVGDALRALRKARLDGITQSRQDEEDLALQWSSTTD